MKPFVNLLAHFYTPFKCINKDLIYIHLKKEVYKKTKIHKEIIEQFDMPNHREKGGTTITATGNTEEKINPL